MRSETGGAESTRFCVKLPTPRVGLTRSETRLAELVELLLLLGVRGAAPLLLLPAPRRFPGEAAARRLDDVDDDTLDLIREADGCMPPPLALDAELLLLGLSPFLFLLFLSGEEATTGCEYLPSLSS